MNNSYSITQTAAYLEDLALPHSGCPNRRYGSNLGNVFLGGNGFTLMIIVAAIVAAAILAPHWHA